MPQCYTKIKDRSWHCPAGPVRWQSAGSRVVQRGVHAVPVLIHMLALYQQRPRAPTRLRVPRGVEPDAPRALTTSALEHVDVFQKAACSKTRGERLGGVGLALVHVERHFP